jgi:NAD(P) transhydrogenase
VAYDYDLIAIGSGPGGQRAAIQASKVGRRSAVVERRLELGGVSVNTGTIASKTLRETVLHLTGQHQRAFYGSSYRVKADITFDDLRERSRQVIEREIDVIRSQLARNHVQVLTGAGSFVDAHTVALTGGGLPPRTVTAESFVIAVGTRPPGLRAWTSTTAPSSIPTDCCSWAASRARSSSSARA